MTQLSYCVGIDLGTTYSEAAVCRDGDPRPTAVPLGALTPAVPSTVFLAPDGSMLCGEAAHRRAVTDPRRVVREFTRRIGDSTPLVIGGRPVAAETVAARFVAWILERVAEREGGPADRIALTHPAEWGPHKRESVAAALTERGVADVLFVPEPEAAAVGYANTERVDVGATVAVYDLGGGTFDAAVVARLPDGRFEILGQPVRIERLGGVDFDEAVFDHVRAALGHAWRRLDPAHPTVQTAVAGLRRECTAAKEALSADTEVNVPVLLPGLRTQVRLARAELEEQIRPAVAETVEALRRAIVSAGVPDPDTVLMVGGSSRIPLIAQLLSAELGRPVAVDADPKSVIAVGAAAAARDSLTVRPGADVGGGARTGDGEVPPPCPPLYLEPVRGNGQPTAARPRRARTLAMAAVLSVAATVGLGVATVASEVGSEGTAGAGGSATAAGDPAGGDAEIDPWTGTARTDTTISGPRRPMVLAAARRPTTRTADTGAAGASPAIGPAAPTSTAPAAVPGAVDPGPAGPPAGGPATSTPVQPTGQPTDEPTRQAERSRDRPGGGASTSTSGTTTRRAPPVEPPPTSPSAPDPPPSPPTEPAPNPGP